MKFRVHQDISKAETLPSIFYKNQDVFDEVKEKIFLKSLGFSLGVDTYLLQELLPIYRSGK